MLALMIPIAYATTECSRQITPTIAENCTITSHWNYTKPCSSHIMQVQNSSGQNIQNYTFRNLSTTGRCFVYWGISTVGQYHYEIGNGDVGDVEVAWEVDQMAGLAILIFVNAIAAAVFFIAFKVRFTDDEFANFVIRRCLIIFGLLLVSLNTAIALNVANVGGLGISQELFRYLWIINWTIYASMVFLVWSTIQNGLKLWKGKRMRERMGNEQY